MENVKMILPNSFSSCSAVSSRVPIWEKALLSLEEAAAYSGIGMKRLRYMTDDPSCDYVLWVGNRRRIKRKRFDDYLEKAYSI